MLMYRGVKVRGYGKDHSGQTEWYAHAHVVPIHHEEPR